MDRFSFDNIIADLEQVNRIFAKADKCIAFEDLKTLAQFYKHHQNTDAAISSVAGSIFDNIDYYGASAFRLKELCDKFQQLYAQSAPYWDTFDFEGACRDFLYHYEQPYEETKAMATAKWQRFQSLSNRLDFMPFDDPSFKDLMTICDSMESDYRACSNEVKRLHQELRSKENYIAEVYFFKMSYLVVLVGLWGHIAESLINDVERIKNAE